MVQIVCDFGELYANIIKGLGLPLVVRIRGGGWLKRDTCIPLFVLDLISNVAASWLEFWPMLLRWTMWPLGLLFSGYLLASYTPLNALKAIGKTNVIILKRKALIDKYVRSLIRYDVNKKNWVVNFKFWFKHFEKILGGGRDMTQVPGIC